MEINSESCDFAHVTLCALLASRIEKRLLENDIYADIFDFCRHEFEGDAF